MINPRVRFKNDNGNDYPDWEKCIVDDVFVERNELHLITDDAPQLSFTIEQGVIYPEDKKTNKRDFLIKDKSSKKFLLTEYNDIIYNPANLKFGAIHRNKLGRGVVSPIYAIFKTDQDPVFMEYMVRNPRFIKRSLKYLEGTVIMLMTLKPRDFVKMKISVPCIEEQKKISDFLSKIDTLISISEQEINKYKELKKGCMKKMFPRDGADVPEVRFPGFTNAWEQRKFMDGISEVGDGLHGTPTYSDDGCVYFVNGNNLVDGRIVINADTKTVDEDQQSFADKALDDTTILMSINGTIGNLAYYSGEKLMLGKSAAYIKVSSFDKAFVYAYLQAPSVQNYFMDSLTGTTIKNLGLKAIREMALLIPQDVDEQEKIGSFFSDLDNLITLHQRECEKYRELKAGLMQKMFV